MTSNKYSPCMVMRLADDGVVVTQVCCALEGTAVLTEDSQVKGVRSSSSSRNAGGVADLPCSAEA